MRDREGQVYLRLVKAGWKDPARRAAFEEWLAGKHGAVRGSLRLDAEATWRCRSPEQALADDTAPRKV